MPKLLVIGQGTKILSQKIEWVNNSNHIHEKNHLILIGQEQCNYFVIMCNSMQLQLHKNTICMAQNTLRAEVSHIATKNKILSFRSSWRFERSLLAG